MTDDIGVKPGDLVVFKEDTELLGESCKITLPAGTVGTAVVVPEFNSEFHTPNGVKVMMPSMPIYHVEVDNRLCVVPAKLIRKFYAATKR